MLKSRLVGVGSGLVLAVLLADAGEAHAARAAGPYAGSGYSQGDYYYIGDSRTYFLNPCADGTPEKDVWGYQCMDLVCPGGRWETSGYSQVCVQPVYGRTNPYIVGPSPGDIMFHMPSSDYDRMRAAFPSPITAAQEVMFEGRPGHTSACSQGWSGVCTWQLENDVDPKQLGAVIDKARVGLYLNWSYGFSVSGGLEDLGKFAIMGGTREVAVLTAHPGLVNYFAMSSDVRANLTNRSRWGLGTTPYQMGGFAHYVPRSQCSETVADVAGLTSSEGYRATQFNSALIEAKKGAVTDRIRTHIYQNVHVSPIRNTLVELTTADFVPDFFNNFISCLARVIVPNLNVNDFLKGALGSTVNNYLALSHVDPATFDLPVRDLLSRFGCEKRNWYGSLQIDASARCMGWNLLATFDSLVSALTWQSFNLMVDYSTDAYGAAYGTPVRPDSFYTPFTATGDLYARLARAAQGQPCTPLQPCPYPGTTTTPTVPVYRFYRNNDHLQTLNYAEGMNAGYTYEGIGFKVIDPSIAQPAGTHALYRCQYSGHHMVSLQSSCEGASYEGKYGYVYDAATSNSAQIWRYYLNGDHITSSGTEGSMSREASQGFAPL